MDLRQNNLSVTEWSYHPYAPFLEDRGDIYITRIVPERESILIEWRVEDAEKVSVHWRRRDEENFNTTSLFTDGKALLKNLEEDCDYEFFLQDKCGNKSLIRLARTGDYLYQPIQYLHKDDKTYAFSGRYLCSPTIVRQTDGSLLASMDVYEHLGAQNLTMIFRSDDAGKTWNWQCELFPCFWGKLFKFKDEVYMIACSTEHGDILLGKALDGGKRFTTPTVLLRGSGRPHVNGVDMSPQPPIEYGGRLWFNFCWGAWLAPGAQMHHPCVMSAPLDSDILNPSSWVITPPCVYDETWPGTAKGKSKGALEGTFIVLPNGELYMMARYEIKACEPNFGLALLYKVRTDDSSKPLEYVQTIKFDGNHSKFTIQRDGETGDYYSIISRIRGSEHINDRNLLSLVKSSDGIHWKLVTDLIDKTEEDPKRVGFQYVDFFIEGDDIHCVIRAGMNGADNFHNSNVILYDKIENFRRLSYE